MFVCLSSVGWEAVLAFELWALPFLADAVPLEPRPSSLCLCAGMGFELRTLHLLAGTLPLEPHCQPF
jgi:hypothetical protein